MRTKDILFLDANILFSAAYREHAGLLQLWELSTVKLISSPYAIEEANRNLESPEQKKRLDALLIRVEKFLPSYEELIFPDNVVLNEKDKPILLGAIAAKADYLITGDVKDFGKFYGKKINGVVILPPAEYLLNNKNKL